MVKLTVAEVILYLDDSLLPFETALQRTLRCVVKDCVGQRTAETRFTLPHTVAKMTEDQVLDMFFERITRDLRPYLRNIVKEIRTERSAEHHASP